MSEEVLAGFESRLYYKSGSNWVEIPIAQDVEINDSPDMLEASARFDGVKRSWFGMVDGTITVKILAIKGEAIHAALKALAIAKTPVELAWTEGDDITEDGTVYGRDWFGLTWKRSEPLNGMPTIDIEAKPTIKFDENGALIKRSFVTVS